jgi:F0F1-type ATP synthase assembly protein I
MIYAVKVAVSALLIVLISEVSKKFPTLGGLIASLPLLSVLGMVWLYADTRDSELLATQSLGTFWFVLPSLPMFLLMPWLLRKGLSFALALSLGCLLTIGLYTLMVLLLKRFGIAL